MARKFQANKHVRVIAFYLKSAGDYRRMYGNDTPRSIKSSGLHTPVGKIQSENNSARSVGYYFDQLKNHFNATNDEDRYDISCTRFLCQVFDGICCV